MKIRRPKKSELKNLVEIFVREYAKPPWKEKWKKELASNRFKWYFQSKQIYVADISGKAVGFISFSFFPWLNS